jgi:hypothetical protein
MPQNTPVLLEQARGAFDRGDLKQALRLGWEAGANAASRLEEPELRQTEELARLIAEASEGDLRDDARGLETYCTVARENPKSKQSRWSRLPGRLRRAPVETKVCPDCAEEVKADARVCRFCGYRFEEV